MTIANNNWRRHWRTHHYKVRKGPFVLVKGTNPASGRYWWEDNEKTSSSITKEEPINVDFLHRDTVEYAK